MQKEEDFMKKCGYTLAETLITMAVIGIIAASLIPLINKFKPDANHMMFLKTYDSLVTLLNAISSNESLFPAKCTNQGNPVNCNEAPLFNMDPVVDYKGKTYSSGTQKLCEILGDSFNDYATAEVTCKNLAKVNDTNFSSYINFTALNGVQFSINTDTSPYYVTTLTFDINGNNKPNCIYNSTTCTEPDRFRLFISADGHIVASDSMAQKYLQTRTNPRKVSYNTTNNNGGNNSSMPEEIKELPPEYRIELSKLPTIKTGIEDNVAIDADDITEIDFDKKIKIPQGKLIIEDTIDTPGLGITDPEVPTLPIDNVDDTSGNTTTGDGKSTIRYEEAILAH